MKEITVLLGQVHADRTAQDQLYRLIESRFHAMAQRLMKRERSDHTLQATVLMDDAFVRLLADENPNWANRCWHPSRTHSSSCRGYPNSP